jgi:hypothetical protein
MRKLFLILIFISLCISCTKIPFDKSLWLDARKAQNWSIVLPMARTISSNQDLIGKNRVEIHDLLGKPDFDKQDRDLNPVEDSYTVNIIWRGIDPASIDYLVFTFDQNGTVNKVELKQIEAGR